MKNGTASEPSGVILEILKASGEPCLNSLTAIVNIYFVHKLPEEWMLYLLEPIFKENEDPLSPNLYRQKKIIRGGFQVVQKSLGWTVP